MQKQIIAILKANRQLILYALIGGGCAFLDFLVYTALTSLASTDYLWANVVSVHCGIFCSFALNRQYNFRVKNRTKARFLSFYCVGLLGLAISSGMLYLMVQSMGIDELVSKLVTVVAVALVQFVLNKFVTFRTDNAKKTGMIDDKLIIKTMKDMSSMYKKTAPPLESFLCYACIQRGGEYPRRGRAVVSRS